MTSNGVLSKLADENADLRATIETIKDLVVAGCKKERSFLLRMLSEDLLVIGDAFYTNDSAPMVLAANTIMILLDAKGCTPEPPAAAFQQVINAKPLFTFTSDELVRIRRRHSGRIHGKGIVEEFIETGALPDIRAAAEHLRVLTVGVP